jgi:cation transport ATPase
MRFLEISSLVCAGLAFVLSWAGPAAFTWVLVLALVSLAIGTLELLEEPRRAVLTLSFLPAFAIVLGTYTLEGAASGSIALAAAAIGLQGRLYFLREARKIYGRNKDFSNDLKESIPAKATVFVDIDIEGSVDLASIHEGHLIRIHPEEVLPVDGQLTYGSSFVDESSLCGEKEPRTKSMGSFAYAGSKNRNGTFLYKAISAPDQSHAQRLAAALEKGFPYEALFTPHLFLLEASLFGVAILFFAIGHTNLSALLNVFLASSGTAFTTSAWIRNQSVVARSAAEGITWKSKESLEKIALTGTVVSTATGVLTEGRLRISEILGTEHTGEDGAIRLMGPLARRLETEAGFSVLQEMNSRRIQLEPVDAYSAMPGGGAGLVTGEEVRWVDVETARLEGIPMAKLEPFAREHIRAGESVHLLLREGRAAAAFAFSDKILPTASAGLALLARQDIPYLLVTTEPDAAVQRLQQDLELTHVHGDCGLKQTESLLAHLDTDGLHPLWIAVPNWRLGQRRGGLVAAAAAGPGACSEADAVTLRSDLNTVARLVRLARLHVGEANIAFRLMLVLQFALILVGLKIDPRFAAPIALLPGVWFLATAKRIGDYRF